MNKIRIGDTVWVKSRLAAGMFSHERTYFIAAPNEGEYQGAVQVHFCLDEDDNPIPDQHPTGEQAGLVEGLVVQADSSGKLVVAIPGDQNIVINPDLVTEIGGARRVPVRP